MRVLKLLKSGIRWILWGLVAGLRPLLGPASCRFTVGCTRFALCELENSPLFTAVWNIVKRLLSCQGLMRGPL